MLVVIGILKYMEEHHVLRVVRKRLQLQTCYTPTPLIYGMQRLLREVYP